MSLSLWVFISCRSHKALFVVLPDTQTYLEAYPEVLESQFNWISDNHNKIDALIHVGDLTQDNHPVEWMLLSRYFSDIEETALPYTFSLGNHDMGSKPGQFADQHNTSLANRFFPVSRFKAKKEWGGNGYLRIVTFDRKKETLEVKTYSTLEDKYHPSPAHNFIFTDLKLNDHLKKH